jgi:hypothetical protein
MELYKRSSSRRDIFAMVRFLRNFLAHEQNLVYSICDIYGTGQMPHRSVRRWVGACKFKSDYEHLKDAACLATVTSNNMLEINQILQKDTRYAKR